MPVRTIVLLVVISCCLLAEVFPKQYAHRKLQSEIKHNVHLGKFISAINATIDEVVDAKLHELAKVYHSGNICPFKRTVIPKMIKKEKFKILIVGGSVTYGADLRNRMQERWSTYFTEIMNSGWYEGQIEVVNIGVGACNVDVWIDKVSMMTDADFVIVDLSVNDQGFDLQALPHLYNTFIHLIDALPNHPALMFHQAFRTGLRDPREYEAHCPLKQDQGSCCNGFLYCKRWWDMQDFVAIPLTRLSVPFVSYRDLIWPSYEHPPPVLDAWWNGMSHPDYKAHKMIAKLIAFGVMMQVKEAHLATHCEEGGEHSRYVSSSDIDNTIQPICAAPLSRLHPGETPQSIATFPAYLLDGSILNALPVPASTPWRYYNDSQLKFGWILDMTQEQITTQCGNNEKSCAKVVDQSVLAFKLNFGESPRLQISFLKSYVGTMGAIAAWIDDHKSETIYIDGHWDLPYSVAHTLTITKEPLVNVSTTIVGDAALFPSLTAGAHTLHLSMPAASNGQPAYKWKLLGLTSC